MSIILRGVKMPESCHDCICGYGGFCFSAPPESDGKCPISGRPDWCPAQEVEQPHGRLINADALRKRVKTECNPYGKPTIGFDDGCKVMDMIDNAPTIIEAEGRGT